MGLGRTGGFSVEPIQKVFVRNSQSLMKVLLAAVAGVLLIACANVANLLLVRSTVRKREMAIRAAMGADRSRIIRQLMTESVLLAMIGGALGPRRSACSAFARCSRSTPPGFRAWARMARPSRSTGGSCCSRRSSRLARGCCSASCPRIHAARDDLSGTLRDGAGSGAAGRSSRVRSTLVVLEMALALTLVIGSGLLIRTSLALRAVAPGFDANNVLTMRMSFTGPRFQTASAVDQVIRDGVDRLKLLPGVELASAACCVPLEGGFGLRFKIVGRPLEQGPWHGGGSWMTVSPGYFEVFKIPVIRGRTFTETDTRSAPAVVIINESMAKEYWKTGDPIGEHLTIARGGMSEFATEPTARSSASSPTAEDNGLNQDPGAKMFVPAITDS